MLCYSIDDDIRQQLAKEFRNSCPHGRIVVITNQPILRPLIAADAFVYGIEGTEALIDAVRGKSEPCVEQARISADLVPVYPLRRAACKRIASADS